MTVTLADMAIIKKTDNTGETRTPVAGKVSGTNVWQYQLKRCLSSRTQQIHAGLYAHGKGLLMSSKSHV